MKSAFLNFIRSFYSVDPYYQALNSRVSGGINLLVATLVFCVVSVLASVIFALVIRYYSLGPIIERFPDVEIVKGQAKIHGEVPLVLTGRPGLINALFVKEKEPKRSVIDMHIDTHHSAEYLPNMFSQPRYRNYTFILARDGFITNGKTQKLRSFKKIRYKYFSSSMIDVYFYLVLAFGALFIVPYVAVVGFFVVLGLAWRIVFLSLFSAVIIRLMMKKPFGITPIFTLGLFILFPGGLYFALARLLVSFPAWLFYLVCTGFLCLCLMQYQPGNKMTKEIE